MENENDVMADVIERLHGEYGNVMGVMDNTHNTIDGDICDHCDAPAFAICAICGASLCNDHGAMHGDEFVCRYTYT